MTTISQAKKIIRQNLVDLNLPYDKLTAKTISFSDLARGSCIFVKIHGWQPNPKAEILRNIAIENGFRVEFSIVFK